MSLSLTEGLWPTGSASRRWPLLVALAAAHLAVLWLLGSQLLAQQRGRPEAAKQPWASLTLWLRPAPAVKPPEKPPQMPIERPRPEPITSTPLAQDLPPSTQPNPTATGVAADATPASPAHSGTPTEAASPPRAPLRIELPKPGKAGEFTKFHNPALSDPRSNTKIRLSLEEKMAIALGTVECILEERQPDGSIWRGGGRLITLPPAIAAMGSAGSGTLPPVVQCVR